jgi:hypothetical protein
MNFIQRIFANLSNMRTLISCLFLFASASVYAQQFEGTVKWGIKMEFKDSTIQAMVNKENEPKEKPKLNGPGNATPVTKKAGEGSARPGQTRPKGPKYPKEAIASFKDGNSLTKIIGGMRNHEVLYLKTKDQAYSLDSEQKTYSVVPQKDKREQAGNVPEVKVTKTSERAEILGYQCTKYLAESDRNGRPLTQEIWATTDIPDLDMSSLGKQRMGKIKWALDKIDGVPLKMTMKNNEGTFTMQATEIKRESLEDKTFTIPADYKELPFN